MDVNKQVSHVSLSNRGAAVFFQFGGKVPGAERFAPLHFRRRVRVGDLAHCATALVVVLRNRLIMMIIIIVYGGDILCVK
jgi:hypothetical protein